MPLKNAQRILKIFTLVSLPLIVLYTLVNFLILAEHQRTPLHFKQNIIALNRHVGDIDHLPRTRVEFDVNRRAGVETTTVQNDVLRNVLLPPLIDTANVGTTEPSRDGVSREFINVKKRPLSGREAPRSNRPQEVVHPGFDRDTAQNEPAKIKMQDDAIDIMIDKLKHRPNTAPNQQFFPKDFWTISYKMLAKLLGAPTRKGAPTLQGYESIAVDQQRKLPAWKKVHRNIRQYSMYDPDDPNVDQLLHDMATLPIAEMVENDGGTQLKVTARFSDGGRAIMKPMRYPRELEADENRYIFDDLERHVAEIAAFQLDRVLGFYRVPPTVGRWVNITSEMLDILPPSIFKTVFFSPAGNICFYGKCSYYCTSSHAFCGHPDMIEVSLMSYLPSRNIANRKSWYQPYKRAYSRWNKAYWEEKDDLCESIRYTSPFNNGKLLLDMIDAHTFDFFGGNKDRHSFGTFMEWGNYSFPFLYDNGRGYGRQNYDAMSILAPLRQCCMIRKSTLLKYIKLYSGPERLSDLMEVALRTDPVAPVLLPGHLNALDRRLIKILQAVAKCLETHPVDKVAIRDRF